MSGYALNSRLLHPSKSATLAELADLWESHIITVRVVGMGTFIQCPSLLNKIRGSLGHVLIQSGSSVLKDRKPCDWTRVCAAEPLFAKKPKINVGPYLMEIAKPYRLAAQKDGQDLLVSISLFGFSKMWIDEVKWALILALREFVAWNVLARDGYYFVPRNIQVLEPKLENSTLKVIDRKVENVMIVFITPLDAERGNIHDRPQTLFERLLLRITMLARWHDVCLVDQWGHMEDLWKSLTYEFNCFEGTSGPVVGGHKYINNLNTPSELNITGKMSKCIDLLRIGESIGFGRGAVIGLGEFAVRQ